MKKPVFKLINFKIAKAAGFILIASVFTALPLFAGGGHFTGTFDPSLGMTITIFQENSLTELSSMDFGTLVETASGGGKVLRGNVGFVVFIYPQVSFIYQVYCTGTAMTNTAGNTLPAGACVVTPVYSASDNDFGAGPTSMPVGSSVGSPGSWVTSSPRVIYNDASAEYRAVQAHFAISEGLTGSSAAVPIYQPAGNYTGTVTITIVNT